MSEESPTLEWKFFHVVITWGTLGEGFLTNLPLDHVITGLLCPFIAGEVYASTAGVVVNPKTFRTFKVYGTDRVIDSTWPPVPPPKPETLNDNAVQEFLDAQGHNCSTAAFNAAGALIASGAYETALRKISRELSKNDVFVISRIGDTEVDNLYRTVLKPRLAAHGFRAVRADEIRHTALITGAITEGIAKARFIVADLTNARPNCYYELGYAHALGKPCILLAKEGTERHFDVAGYRWNYWTAGVDYSPKFDEELEGVLEYLQASALVGTTSESDWGAGFLLDEPPPPDVKPGE